MHPRASNCWRSVGTFSGSSFLLRVSPIPSIRRCPCGSQIRFLLTLVPRSGTQVAPSLCEARSRPATSRPARSGRTPAEHPTDGVPPAERATRSEDRFNERLRIRIVLDPAGVKRPELVQHHPENAIGSTSVKKPGWRSWDDEGTGARTRRAPAQKQPFVT